MIGYASRTGTRRNLAALREAGWRLLVSARGALRTEGFAYGLDNGAWTAHQKGEPFDSPAFVRALAMLGADADFIVAPDIVAGGIGSLRMTEAWLPKLERYRLVLVAVQDGMSVPDIRPLLSRRVGIFIGGTTQWKEETMVQWGALAREREAHMHVGRVNSQRRIRMCHQAGADSFDGTSASRYAVTLPRLTRAAVQEELFFGDHRTGFDIRRRR